MLDCTQPSRLVETWLSPLQPRRRVRHTEAGDNEAVRCRTGTRLSGRARARLFTPLTISRSSPPSVRALAVPGISSAPRAAGAAAQVLAGASPEHVDELRFAPFVTLPDARRVPGALLPRRGARAPRSSDGPPPARVSPPEPPIPVAVSYARVPTAFRSGQYGSPRPDRVAGSFPRKDLLHLCVRAELM